MKNKILSVYVIGTLLMILLLSSCKSEDNSIMLAKLNNIEEYELSSTNRAFVIASDKNGEILDWKELSGSTVSLSTATSVETFSLTFVFAYSSNDNYKSTIVSTYFDLKPGFERTFLFSKPNTLKANVQLDYEGLTVLTFNDRYESVVNSNAISVNAPVYFQNTPLIVYRYPNTSAPPVSYKYFPQSFTTNGDTHLIDATSNYTPLTQVTINKDLYAHVIVAKPDITNLASWLVLPSSTDETADNQFTYYYPEASFQNFGSMTWYVEGNKSITMYRKNKLIETNEPNWDATVDVTNNNLSINTNSSDLSFITIFLDRQTDKEYCGWIVYSTKSNGEIVLPQLPNEIKSLVGSEALSNWTNDNLNYISLNALEGFKDLDSFILDQEAIALPYFYKTDFDSYQIFYKNDIENQSLKELFINQTNQLLLSTAKNTKRQKIK